jgi:tetratricopeptide (TPR) repeat protein
LKRFVDLIGARIVVLETETDLADGRAARLGANPDRLNSWKEIARYLKRQVRTVQLWERHEGLPVHRHFHNQLSTVFAFRSEIEAWGERRIAPSGGRARSRNLDQSEEVSSSPCPIVVAPAEVGQDEGLSTFLAAIARELELTPLAARVGKDTALVLCIKGDFRADCLVVELFSPTLKSVVWSCPLGANTAKEPAVLARQISQKMLQSPSSVAKPVATISRSLKAGAREAYAKGRYLWSRRNEEDLRKATHWFRTAIWRDPEFALAYTGVADSLTLLSFYEIVPAAEAMPQAREAALRALALDPNLAEAHTSLADVNLHDWQWEAAGEGFRRAIECDPGYALGYHWYANLLAATGQHDAAYLAVMQALEIEPASLIAQVWAGVTCYFARRFDEAIRHYRNALELDQNFAWTHMYMARALEQKGFYGEAVEAFDTCIRLSGGSSCVSAMKAHAYAQGGDRQSAQETLDSLRRVPFGKCVPSYDIAATYVALGDAAGALRWLQRACGERNMKLFTLSQDPRFDGLGGHAEFHELVQRINKCGVSSEIALRRH